MILPIIMGTIAGTITGLIPGIHTNLVAILLISISPTLLKITTPLSLVIFITSMAITHTFLDAIPSIFLGAPDSDQILSVLPGHKLLLEGRGYEAIKLTTLGSFLGLITTLLLFPFFIFILRFYDLIKNSIPYILIVCSFFLIIKDKSKFPALFIFLLSGSLGLAVFKLTLSQPLLPMLSGLFGISTLVISIQNKTTIPKQKNTPINLTKKQIAKSISLGTLASTITGLLPGIGASQAAVIASSLSKKWSKESFLVLIGSINTVVMVISIAAYYVIQKARNGAIVAASKIIPELTLSNLITISIAIVITAILASLIALITEKTFSKQITKLNYQLLCISIIILVTTIVFIFSGFLGLLILTTSTFIGILPPLLNTNKNHLMGCLILPTILYLLL